MEPIKRRKLYHGVLDQLVAAISTREFAPGTQLPSERELMVRFAVGRPAIREAMLTLQQMGLVRISHGERARVNNPTADAIIDQVSGAVVMMLSTNPRGLDELKQARLLLETGLVRIATQSATREHLERLAQAQRDLVAASSDQERFVACDLAFHGLIADMSGNALIGSVMRAMLAWLSRFKRDMVSVRGANRLTIEEHERILRAISAGDAQAAVKAMSDHLTRANALYRQLTASEEPVAGTKLV
jgi:DNA-binding FadR family transcriptional regulator